MPIKVFGDKKIEIRKISKKDPEIAEKFRDFLNSLIKESAMISRNKMADLKEQRKFLRDMLKAVKNKTKVFLVAECDNKIVGTANAGLREYRRNHIARFGVEVGQRYRGIGLGEYMTRKIIELAKRNLKPKPIIIELTVMEGNNPAINLYKKIGFKVVAVTPRGRQYKNELRDEIKMHL